MSYLDLKGVHSQIKPEFQAQLSPIFGYTLLETQNLAHRRFYGNYGEKHDAHSCIFEGEMGHKDCPQDFNSEWIQRLFPSQDGANFVANQLPQDPLSHLTPETIGELLGKIASVADDNWHHEEITSSIQNELSKLWFLKSNPRGYCNFLARKHKSKVAEFMSSPKKEQILLKDQLETLEHYLLSLFPGKNEDEVFPTTHKLKANICTYLKQSEGTKEDFDNLSHILVSAVKESRLPPQRYPKYLPEQALLAYFLHKNDRKKDFLYLFKGMPHVLTHPEILIEGDEQFSFLQARFERSEYNPDELEVDSEEAVEAFSKDPERLIFLLMEDAFVTKSLPPILAYRNPTHSSLKDEFKKTYSDCGETSLRNFFNIVLYQEGKFESKLLDKMRGVSIHPELRDFYTKYSDPADAAHYRLFEIWGERVASTHHGVKYLKPGNVDYPRGVLNDARHQCEIGVGIDNMMEVVDRLLYANRAPGQKGPIASAESRSEKIDKLCKAVSREGFELTHQAKKDIVDSNDTEIAIQFNINGHPSFKWGFKREHFAIEDLTLKEDSWKNTLEDEWEMAMEDVSARSIQKELLFLWFSSENVLSQVQYHPSSHLRENLLYSFPLNSSDAKLAAFRQIVTSPHALAIKLKPFATRLRAQLNEDEDTYARQEIHTSLADGDNPYEGNIMHPLGKTEVTYKRVSHQELEQKLGQNAAEEMGRTWKREMFGHFVAIGEPLLHSTGVRHMNFEDAKRVCLDLNRQALKPQIEKVFHKREEKLHQFRVKHQEKLKQSKRDELSGEEHGQVDHIFRETSIPGCYLPSREEWKIVEADLGAQEDHYVPQLLPQLDSEFFWSSSYDPNNHHQAFVFKGLYGYVVTADPSSDKGVRCFCGVESW